MTMTKGRVALLSAGAWAILAGAGPAFADAPFRSRATPGTRHYRYTSIERAEGQPETRYRVDFDLVTDGNGGVTAVIRAAESARGGAWSTPGVTEECRKALHGSGAALARVTLAPLAPEAAAALGEPFMAMCAPAAYFFPMTDILNVSLIQTAPRFHLADLVSAGTSARFEGYQTRLDRLGTGIVASAPGGTITLAALDERSATVDWAPDPMQLTIVRHAAPGSPEVTLTGVEHYAFRVEIDRAAGALRHAATTSDRLDLVVSLPGLPPDRAPRVAVTRAVEIEPRDEAAGLRRPR